MNRIVTILLLLIISSCLAQRKALSDDPRTQALITQGRRLMQSKSYKAAADAFEEAALRPFSYGTTAAIYLSGLAYYYAEDDFFASQRFNTILEEYPESKYAEDARYHNALIQTGSQREENQMAGYETLFKLWDSARDREIAKTAKGALLQNLFYDADIRFVERLYHRSNSSRKLIVLEALCHRLIQVGRQDEARQRYGQWLSGGGSASVFLDKALEDVPPPNNKLIEPDYIKLAVFLPLNLDDPRIIAMGQLPASSGFVLEFYEGFQKAVENYSTYSRKKIYMQVFDTRSKRDTFLTKRHLESLEHLQPDLIVGDIYNIQSKVISQWAMEHQTPQIVPLSPDQTLTKDNPFVFLAHPSIETHGVKMAEYAANRLELQKVAVWTDQRTTTEMMAQGFIRTMEELGRETIRIEVDSFFEEGADEQIPTLVKSMSQEFVDGVYIPIVDNEESSNLILSKMSYDNIDIAVMGSPHWWKRYSIIDRELKESYQLLFTSSSMIQTERPEYKKFYNDYLRDYKMPPKDFAIQGYDLGMYVLKMMDFYDYQSGMSLPSYLRTFPAYQSIHLDYYFGGMQSNQEVNVGAFMQGGVFRVDEE